MRPDRIILAGGSGFIGRVLSRHFVDRGREVVVLTRNPKPASNGVREVQWDGETLGDWAHELEGATALINLAGVSVNCRYHERNRRLILDSRINSTRVLGEAIACCKNPPPVWLNSSTATIYKHNFGPAWDESGEIGGTPQAKDEFSVEVAEAWERAFNEANTPRTRKAALRSAMVLGLGSNSVFPTLRNLVRFGLGGKMANGDQFVSWIHETDFCRAIGWLMEHEELSGVFNLAAPNPITNREMMRTLRAIYRIPFGMPAALSMLEAGAFFLRTETELIIKSRRVVSRRLPESGFQFRFTRMEDAFRDLAGRH
ncbi:MAG TPA: TIGR01777 family oxidoreductase [Verrucomicrobiota bacterium]|nr:TIGR01777 family oxidoreductase [Verrucomicrobiota bacterium]